MKKIYSWFILLGFFAGNSFAQISFTENKGQWESEIMYKTAMNNGALFITPNGIVYHFEDTEKKHHLLHGDTIAGEAPIMIDHYAFRLSLQNSNPNAAFTSALPGSDYENYFIGKDKSKWATEVRRYQHLTQHDIYNGIDLKYYTKDNGLKYEFVVAPHKDPSVIKFKIEGITPAIDKEGNIHYKTPLGTITENAPVCFQVIDKDTVLIPSEFHLKNNVLSFKLLADYQKDYPLVIDPHLVFSTYSGGTTSSFYAYTSSYDSSGNMYSGGIAWGTGWPVTTGAFQTQFYNGVDVCIIKYNSSGTQKMFTTLYGGFGEDIPLSISVNANEEVAIAGHSRSRDLPMLSNSFDSTLANDNRNASWANVGDIFVVTFNANATQLTGATYLGGTDDEASFLSDINLNNPSRIYNSRTCPLYIRFDSNDDIWLVSNTESSDFPVTSNAFQSGYKGATDGVVCKLNKSCSQLLFSSFIGGGGREYLSYFDFNNNGGLVVSGFTKSDSLPTFANSYISTHAGGEDAYIFVLDTAIYQITNSTYLGTNLTDEALKIAIEPSSQNVYILGITNGDYPISSGAYSMTNGNLFIHILDSALSLSIASTRIGHSLSVNMSFAEAFLPTSLGFGECDAVIVTGIKHENMGSTVMSMPTTPNAFQATPSSFWFSVLNLNLSQLEYATYMGGQDHIHGGQHQLDDKGFIYNSICSTNPVFPTTPNSWSPNKMNGNRLDIISFKFNIRAKRVNADFELAPSYTQQGCIPHTVVFDNQSFNADEYRWYFGTGDSSTATNPTYTFTDTGTFWVQLVAYEYVCNTTDTATMLITVRDYITPQIITIDTVLCGYIDSLYITGAHITNYDSLMIIEWTPTQYIASNTNIDTIIVSVQQNETYYIKVYNPDSTLCILESNDSISIKVQDSVAAAFTVNDTIGCLPFNAIFTNLSQNADEYKWFFGDGDSSMATHPNHTYTDTGYFLVQLIAYEHTCHTIDTDSVWVYIKDYITPQIITSDTVLCAYYDSLFYTGAHITNYTSGMIIEWTPTQYIASNPAEDSIEVMPREHSTYYIRVYSTDSTQCVIENSDTLTITVQDTVVAAFTINDTLGCLPFNAVLTNHSINATRYLWYFGDGDSSTLFEPTHTYTQPGNYTITLYAYEDVCHSFDMASLSINVYDTITPQIILNDTTICFNLDTLTLNAVITNYDSRMNTEWSPAYGIVNYNNKFSVTVNPRLSATYTFSVFNHNANYCVLPAHRTVNIYKYDSLHFDIQPKETEICMGDTVRLTAIGNGAFEWLPGNNIFYQNQNQIHVNPFVNSVYALKITDTNFCVYNTDAKVMVNDTMPVDAGEGKVIRYGDEATLNGYSTWDYYWYPEHYFANNTIPNPTVKPLQTTTFYLKNSNRCSTIDSVTIIVTDAKLPNAFSPNGDGINDRFYVIQFRDNVLLQQFSIYNRYGERVFYTENIEEGWDGWYKGEPCDVGVYFYFVIYKIGEKSYTEKGDVTLLR